MGSTPTADFVTCTTAHMFKATASSATSTVETQSDPTDSGNVYTESMAPPQTLECSIQ